MRTANSIKLRFAIPLFTALVVVLFTLSCVVSYQSLRDEQRMGSRQEAQRMLLAFEAHSTRLFDYTDGYLRAIRAYHAEHGVSEKWLRFVGEIKAPHANQFSGIVTIVDRAGWVIYQSETPSDKLKSFGSMASLDHFQYFSGHPGDSLYVGATRLGKMTGKLQYRLARPLLRDGVFDGMVMITLLPDHITEFYRDLSLGSHSTVTMLTLEPKLIARQPAPAPEMFGRQFAELKRDYGIDIDRAEGGSAFGIIGPFDDVQRDVFYKKLSSYPVALMVSIAEQDIDDAVAAARRNLSLLALAFTAFALLVCVLALRMSRQNRRLADADAASQKLACQLQTSEAFQVSIMNSVAAEIAVLGRDGTIVAVNEPWQRFSRENSPQPSSLAPNTDVGTNYLDIAMGDDGASAALDGIRAVLDGRLPRFSTEYPCHSPEQIRWFAMMVTPLGQNTNEGVVVTHTEITEQKLIQSKLEENDEALRASVTVAESALKRQQEIQDELVQAEKMAALGGLVAGIAHEINTPIGVTLSSATHLEAETRKTDALYKAGELTEDGLTDYFATAAQATQLMAINSHRASDLIQSFKQVAVDQTGGERRQFDLASYIDEVLLSLQPWLKKGEVEVAVACPPGLLIDGFPGALSQVLSNLLMNSLNHAFDPGRGGHVHIEVRPPEGTGEWIEIAFRDDGKGIPPEFYDKVFEPFFTTRRGKGGSGLGLNIVFNIVHKTLKGTLVLERSSAAGAHFTLRFPRTQPR
jgi:signal transduction histidine kinase